MQKTREKKDEHARGAWNVLRIEDGSSGLFLIN